MTLLESTATGIRGRLDLAWLKVCAFRADRLIKWGRPSEGYEVARSALTLARQLELTIHIPRLDGLAPQARASGIP